MVSSFLIEKEKNRVEIIQLEAQQKDIKSKAIVMRNKVEEDSWARIDMLVEQNKTKLDVSIEQSMVAKGDLTKILKGFREFKQEKEQKQREIDEKNQDYVEQVQTLQQLKAETLVNAQEIKDRDVTLADKWVIIQDLRKKIQELEKFKFVLDYKIKELKREIGPRNEKIQELNEQVNLMRGEYKHFTRVN